MKVLSVLEEEDKIEGDDWCRPLQLTTGYGTELSLKSVYGGFPENNVKWVKVKEVLGDVWIGQEVKNYNNGKCIEMEFMRGDMPKSHQLDMRNYNSLMKR